jgi:eukaryotic-like serine/threonine-protein kinase
MAVVHLATQVTPAGRRLVAIKQIERREEAGRAAHARLVQEAKLVFQLTHANICQVLDLGENELGTFIVIEYVHGCDLGGLVARGGSGGGGLDIGLTLYVIREVARALDYAHRRADAGGRSLGLVHGDVAPRNVLLSIEGEVKLADFGIARARGTTAPGSGLVGGTPGFIAPEVIDGGNDLRSDVYSLGMTLAHALGGPPGPEENAASRALARADLGGVREIIMRSTAREPTARYPSAGEMERALALELSRRYPGFTPTVLANVVRGVVAEREALRSRAAPVRPDSTETTFAMHTLIDQPALPPAPNGTAAFGSTYAAPTPLAGGTATMVPVRHRGAARQRRRQLVLAAGGAALVLGASIAIAIAVKEEPRREAATIARAVPAAPADAAPLAVLPAPAPPPQGAAPDAGAPAAAEPAPVDRPAATRPRAARKSTKPAARDPGFVTVSATPWGVVYIDGKRVAKETPLYRHALPAGRHEIRVFFKEAKKFSERRMVDLQPGQHRSIGFER